MDVTGSAAETTPGGPDDRILPWSQVKIIAGLSRTTIWRLQKTGDFPAAVQVSRNRVGWWQSELLAWKRTRTPRRLPEPRAISVPPTLENPPAVVEASGPRDAAGRGVIAGDAPLPPARRKRRPTVPENQTAFDFGS